MKLQIDLKSLILGVLVTSLVVLIFSLVGPDSTKPAKSPGRFQLQAVDTTCYLADTATGQVWTSDQPDFGKPKLNDSPPPARQKISKDYLGTWRIEDPNINDASILIEKEGRATAYDHGKPLPATWHIENGNVIITIQQSKGDTDILTAKLAQNGRLYITERNSTQRVAFIKSD